MNGDVHAGVNRLILTRKANKNYEKKTVSSAIDTFRYPIFFKFVEITICL